MMHMTFYWGRQVTLLFDSWNADSWVSYLLSLLACFLFSIFYQYMEDKRLRFKLLTTSTTAAAATTTSPAASPLLSPKVSPQSTAKFAGAVLFGVNSAIGYLLMLAIMSFNGGVFIAIVVGLGVGYLVFRSADEAVVVVDNPCACA